MMTGDVSTKNISVSINIAQYAGLTATEGFTYYLGFLALVSISLAVLNLLPVPVLDGGQIAFQVVEMVKGAPLSMKAQVFGQKVGIAMLIVLWASPSTTTSRGSLDEGLRQAWEAC